MNRIEEVKKMKGMYFSDRCRFCHELGEKVEPFLCEDCRQKIFDWVNSKGWTIHQFPQPLDDKELEKAIYQVLIDNTSKRRERYGDIEVTHIDTNIGDSIKPILALLPSIEEAKTRLRAQAPNLIEEAKEQERERILKLLPEITTRFDHNRTCFDCIETIKRQALKGGE